VTAPNPQVDSDPKTVAEVAAELRTTAGKIAGSVTEAATTLTAVAAQPPPAGARPSPALTAAQELMHELPTAVSDTAVDVRSSADELEEEAGVLDDTQHDGAGEVREQGGGK
jgi:ABC-type transporter Mla subunit MlaD